MDPTEEILQAQKEENLEGDLDDLAETIDS